MGITVRDKVPFTILFFVGISAIFVAVFSAKVYYLDRKGYSELQNLPKNALPLEEVTNSPKNYLFSCLLTKLVVQEVKLDYLSGELFGICKYVVNDSPQTIAVVLGYVDDTKDTSFVFGPKLGLAQRAVKTATFTGLSKNLGFQEGSVINVVVTTNTNPEEGQGLYGLNTVGEDITKLYKDESFYNFSKTGVATDLPYLGKLNNNNIIFPVFVQ